MDRTPIVPARPTSMGPYRPDPPTVIAYPAAVQEFEEKLAAGELPDFEEIWQRKIHRLYGVNEGPPCPQHLD